MPQLQSSELRIPPQNTELERSILGTMLLKGKSVPLVLSQLSARSFYSEINRRVFEAIEQVFMATGQADLGLVAEKLGPDFDMTYLAELTSVIPNVSNIEPHCSIIRDKWQLRQMIDISEQVQDRCYHGDNAASVSGEFAKVFYQTAAAGADIVCVGDLSKEVFTAIEERYENQNGLLGMSTGIFGLDNLLAGFCQSDLIIVAARPSMGKTALGMGFAESIAYQEVPVLVFSLEMSKKQLHERLISYFGRVDSHRIRTGQIADSDWPKITHALERINTLPIYIDDTPALTVTQMAARAKMQHAKTGVGAIIVDYLQLVKGSGENRTQEVGDISRSLKALAKELNIPVIVLSQLNRSLEQRTDKRPIMSDLRESGAIEQDADVIIFIYRDDVYNKNEDNPARGLAELIVSKQRNGPVGTVKTVFLKEFTRFENLATTTRRER